ncbi:MAG: hypothetical protein R3A11_01350 [Bdellovibrionota bacterium]
MSQSLQIEALEVFDQEIRKILLQIDREKTRKKAIRALQRKLEKAEGSSKAPYYLGLAIAHHISHQYDRSLHYCEMVLSAAPFSVESLWGSCLKVSIYKSLGMKKERFEAEGNHILIMKKIALHSQDPNHREMAIAELRKQFDEGDLQKYFVDSLSGNEASYM